MPSTFRDWAEAAHYVDSFLQHPDEIGYGTIRITIASDAGGWTYTVELE